MGTPSMIGYWDAKTGEVKASYCHYDGYLEGNGATLVAHYNDDDAAWLVANGGYLSALDADYEKSRLEAVHKDPAVAFASVDAYLKDGFDYAGAQYSYLWDGEAWFVAGRGEKFTDVETLLGKG